MSKLFKKNTKRLFELYRELGYLQARTDEVKRKIAYFEASVPGAPSNEPMPENENGGEGQ